MHRSRQLTAAAGLLAAFLAAPAWAQTFEMIGRIESVEPERSSKVVRTGGQEITTEASMPLYAGDRFRFLSSGQVVATVDGHSQTFTSGDAPNALILRKRNVGLYTRFDEVVLQPFQLWLAQPRWPIGVSTGVRGGQPDLATGDQYIGRRAGRLALVWNDPAETLVIKVAGRPDRRIRSTGPTWAFVTRAEAPDGATIQVEGTDAAWKIMASDAAPRPDWLEKPPTSEAQRLSHAIWLLQNDPHWRTFAMSEIADLANAGNYVANQFWIAARSGELTELLARSRTATRVED